MNEVCISYVSAKIIIANVYLNMVSNIYTIAAPMYIVNSGKVIEIERDMRKYISSYCV